MIFFAVAITSIISGLGLRKGSGGGIASM